MILTFAAIILQLVIFTDAYNLDRKNHAHDMSTYDEFFVEKRGLCSSSGKDLTTWVNGCGPEFSKVIQNIPFAFRNLFTPACNRHDVCYGCGKTNGYTRSACDWAMYNDMQRACNDVFHKMSLPHTFDRVRCHLRANSIKNILDTLGGSAFSTETYPFCKDQCVKNHGDPKTGRAFSV